MKNPNNEIRNQLQAKLYDYILIYNDGKITKDELKDFSRLLIEYCKITRHSDCSLITPIVGFNDLDENRAASYYDEYNQVVVSEKFLDYILDGKCKLADLINTIGHEMKHYNQNNLIIDYDNLSSSEQQKIDNKSKESINAYKNYVNLNQEDVKVLHKLLAPYLKENEIPKGYKSIKDFYSDISFVTYYSILSEKEAREEGIDFALNFYKEFSKGKHKLPKKFLSEEEKYLSNEKKLDEEAYVKRKSQLDNFSTKYSADEKTILEIVEKVESKDGQLKKLDTESYGYALRFLIKDKTLEQKKSLLKNAIFNGYPRFIGVLRDSIKDEMDFKSNKSSVSEFIRDCFTGKEYLDENNKIPNSSYYKDYATLLTQDDFENIIENLLKDDARKAKVFITFSSIKNFSLDSVIKYQEILLENKDNIKDNSNLFFNGLFSQVSMENKIEMLKSNKIQPEFINLLVKNIKRDMLYSSYKEQLEPLLKNFPEEEKETNIYLRQLFEDAKKKQGENTSSEKEVVKEETDSSKYTRLSKWFDLSTEKGVNEFFVSYANSTQKYYSNENKRTPEEIQKRRNFNAQVKRILQDLSEEKEESASFNLDFYINSNFSESIIDEVAKNKNATLKLFYIMASGVYERNGEKVRLTQKQRQALANVLTKVSDKRINMDLSQIESKENSEKNIGIQMGE